MSLLTEQETGELWRQPENYGKPLAFARAIESAVIEKIKAQGPAAWLFGENQEEVLLPEEVEPEPFKEYPELYIPLYHLPEGD